MIAKMQRNYVVFHRLNNYLYGLFYDDTLLS